MHVPFTVLGDLLLRLHLPQSLNITWSCTCEAQEFFIHDLRQSEFCFWLEKSHFLYFKELTGCVRLYIMIEKHQTWMLCMLWIKFKLNLSACYINHWIFCLLGYLICCVTELSIYYTFTAHKFIYVRSNFLCLLVFLLGLKGRTINRIKHSDSTIYHNAKFHPQV